MELRRFYIPKEAIEGDRAVVTGDEYRHITGVLRFRVGYKLILCDNSGNDYYCTVSSIDGKEVVCSVDEIKANDTELSYDLTLAAAIIKQDKMELSVQKAVEVGVKRIVLYASARTVEKDIRLDRVERIVKEACKQCGRAMLPQVVICPSVDDMLKSVSGDLYLAYENADRNDRLDKVFTKSSAYTVLIGPEGGFEEEEVEQILTAGAKVFSLGARILRAETAAIVSLGDLVLLGGE